jgi:pimeloyl-ACP methyl ester carboxylesterase
MSAPAVTLHALDAVELAELLEFVHDWLGSDNPGVGDSFRRFTAGGYTLDELRADLARFAFLVGGDGDAFVHGAGR